MPNPLIAEVTRGGIVESRHTGSYAVSDAAGRIVMSAGTIDQPVFPRSAVKAFQCLPVIESGAADRFGFTDAEIALACASHDGEAEHVRLARAMLAKAGNTEADYECGAHWPSNLDAHHDAVRHGGSPLPVHNNCSGKHAAMLALARHLGVDTKHYVDADHPVQQAMARSLSAMCGIDVAALPCGVDGCSVPTWAIPLCNLAQGFARFADPANAAARRIVSAVRNHPAMVGGSANFCTLLMTRVPRAFVKQGAEGVYCACVPHAGLGVAIKCDDGEHRAARVAVVSVLARLDVWEKGERQALAELSRSDLLNRRGIVTGELRPPGAGRSPVSD